MNVPRQMGISDPLGLDQRIVEEEEACYCRRIRDAVSSGALRILADSMPASTGTRNP